MRAGRLRQRVTIQQKSVARDGYGAETVTWTTLATVWASVEPLRGREFSEMRQTQAAIDTRIRLRFREDIEPQMRASWDGHTYDIEAIIQPAYDRRETQLMCQEVVVYA